MRAAWPRPNRSETDDDAAEAFATIQDMISGIRNIRAQYGVPPGKEIAATIAVGKRQAAMAEVLSEHAPYFSRLARVADLAVGREAQRPAASAAVVVGPHQVFVPLAGMIDLDVERSRLRKEIDQKEQFLAGVDRKLRNQQFLNKAPADVVERERAKAADAGAELRRLRESLADIKP
jgi:valyl-tRNA synthetase